MLRFRRFCAAVAAALVFVTSAASAQPQATAEPTLMEVRLGQVASLALRGERDAERLWLPVADLAAAMEFEIVSRSASRVTIRRWPSRELIVLDRDSALVRVGTRRLPVPAGALRGADGDLLADVPTLQQLLHTNLEVSWNDLVIAVPGIDSLPIGRRVAREQARARLSARETQARAERTAPLARPLADGAVLDYSLSAPLTGTQRSLGWSSALGLDVLGGSLEVSTGAVPGGARLPTLSSWTGVWREGKKLSQLRLGDGLGSGPAPRLGRGVMLTNAPYLRPSLFGLQTLRGDLPPGWTIEAYRNGELVAVDTTGRGSGYQLQLPVLYGENPVDLLAVGPFGQTRALTQNLRIGGDLLARNRSEYGVSVAQCRLRQQCLAAGTFDFRVGLTDRWTMRVGVDAVARDSVGWRKAPYFAFSGTPLPMLAVQLDAAAQSRTRLAVNVEPSRQLRVSMEQNWFSADPIDPLIASRRSAQSSVYATWRALGASQSSVEASLDRSVFLAGGGLTRARLAYGTQTAGLRMQPYVRHDQSSRGGYAQTAFGVEATVLPNGARGRYIGSSLLRVISEFDPHGTSVRQAMTLSMPLPGQFRMDAGVAVQRGMRGAITTLALSRDLNALRSYTTANISGNSRSAVQSVQGSAVLSPGAKRPQFVTGPSLQRTGVTGIVFLDRNANGRRDAGEPPVPGVQVQVGTGLSSTDADGRYRVWDLMPFDPLPVSIDSTTLPSPLWIPVLQHTSIEAGPNRFEPLDIPVVAGGVLEGRVSWVRAGSTSLPPIPLLVMNAAGDVIARTHTFSDGEFVLFGVHPGAMSVRIDPAWLAAQGLDAIAAQSVVLPASDEGATLRVPVITIEPPRREVPAAKPDTAPVTSDAPVRQTGVPPVVAAAAITQGIAAPAASSTAASRGEPPTVSRTAPAEHAVRPVNVPVGTAVRAPAVAAPDAPSVHQCGATTSARCSSVDDELRNRRGEQRVALGELHLESQDLRAIAVYQRQPQVAPATVAVAGDVATADAHERPVGSPTIHREGARPAPLDADLERRPAGDTRHRPEREGLADDAGRGQYRRLLAVGDRRRESRREEGRGDADETARGGHETESRPAAIRLRAPPLRARSVPATILTNNRKVEVATREVATSSVLRPAPAGLRLAASPRAAPQVRWRANLNLPDLRVAALSVAVRRPPPDSVPLEPERRTEQLVRSEIAARKARRRPGAAAGK